MRYQLLLQALDRLFQTSLESFLYKANGEQFVRKKIKSFDKMELKNLLFGKLHYICWIVLTIITTLMVFNEEKKSRMILLGVVVVLQFLMLFFFMVDYDRMSSEQWKKKEESLRKELLSKKRK